VKKPIYLDYMATTPVDPRVAEAMAQYLTLDGVFGNPASTTHTYGWQANEAVTVAREQVADAMGAKSSEIIWTSGATEADNLAIIGAAQFYKAKGKHIVTCETEHKAVLDSCEYLEQHGFEVTYLKPAPSGLLSLEQIACAIRDDTVLVSIMHVNNEIGVIQDIAAIGALCRERGVLYHTDAAQSCGKVCINLSALPVDLASFSAHKAYGPKGVGALYVSQKPRVRLAPLIHGGGHEHGLRSGTLPTHQIVGMGKAFALAKAEFEKDKAHFIALREHFWQAMDGIDGLILNGDKDARVPSNINISIERVEGESLRLALRDLALSNTSACGSSGAIPSYVLAAIGVNETLARSSLRISFGRFTTEEEIDFTTKTLREQITRLRELAP